MVKDSKDDKQSDGPEENEETDELFRNKTVSQTRTTFIGKWIG